MPSHPTSSRFSPCLDVRNAPQPERDHNKIVFWWSSRVRDGPWISRGVKERGKGVMMGKEDILNRLTTIKFRLLVDTYTEELERFSHGYYPLAKS